MKKKIDIIFRRTKIGFKKSEFENLIKQCGVSIDKINDIIKNSHKILLAYHNDEIIGFITTISNGYDFVYYDKLGVKKDYRGKGVGWKLFAFMSKYYKTIPVHTLLAKKEMVSFYQKFGFEVVDKKTNDSLIPLVPMLKINYREFRN